MVAWASLSGHLVIPGSFVVVIGGVDSVDNRPFLHVGCWLTVCVHCGRRGRRRWMGVDGRRGGFALYTGSDEMSPLHWPVIHIYPQVCVDMSGSLHSEVVDGFANLCVSVHRLVHRRWTSLSSEPWRVRGQAWAWHGPQVWTTLWTDVDRVGTTRGGAWSPFPSGLSGNRVRPRRNLSPD